MKTTLILMRHGQSVWNKKNLFTGWVDIPLSEEGIKESSTSGKIIRNIPIDVVFTSSLIRSHMSLVLALLEHSQKKIPVFQHTKESKLDSWGQIYSEATQKETLPVYASWELNERMYGHLQGLNKAETAEKYGKEQVQLWRRSFDTIPPGGESLAMTAERTLPYFQKTIVPCLEKGQSVFVCAHGNSLRSIIMHLDHLSKEEVVKLEIATGEVLIYTFDKGIWTKKPSI